ncbi:hypothetical protein JHW43_003379 [Diplocarpon mali]|nr:hypothetical protein JHW43_003379 [Diplocarpon mali]
MSLWCYNTQQWNGGLMLTALRHRTWLCIGDKPRLTETSSGLFSRSLIFFPTIPDKYHFSSWKDIYAPAPRNRPEMTSSPNRDTMTSQPYQGVSMKSPIAEYLAGDSADNSSPSLSSGSRPSSLTDPNDERESTYTYTPSRRRTTTWSRDSQASTEVEGDDGVSLWGGTSSSGATSRDYNSSARDTLVLQLMARVAHLECRLNAQESTKNERGERDIESQELLRTRGIWAYRDRYGAVAAAAGIILLTAGFTVFLVVVVRARYTGISSVEEATYRTLEFQSP